MTSALRGSRVIVFAAVLELLTAITVPAMPLLHDLNDDPCGQSAAGHEDAARLVDGAGSPASPHCSICHWWQSAGRFSGASLPSSLTPLADLGLIAKAAVTGPNDFAVSYRPARAPPIA
jgi:hypothetical protein